MTGWRARLAVLALLVPVAAAAQAPPAATSAIVRERAQLLDRLERLKAETRATEDRAQTLADTLLELAADDAKLRQRLAAVGERVGELEARIAANEEALEALVDEQAAIRDDLAGRKAELAAVLMALQRLGRRPPPALFSEAEGALPAVRGAVLLNAILPELADEANALTATLERSRWLAQEERDRWTRLRGDLSELGEERERLSGLAAELERRRALSRYERDRTTAELARLAEETSSITALLTRLEQGERELTAPPPGFSASRGNLSQPVAGRLVSTFGEVTALGELSQGRTIAALPDATVFSPMPATVLFSERFRSYGHLLILDAGDGYHMVLAGMEETFVAPGQSVEPGMPLGRMGRASRRAAAAASGVNGSALLGSRPALYVELRKDGAAVDSQGWWRNASVDVKRTGG